MLTTPQSRVIQRAMSQELRRAMKGLHLTGHPKPFFMSYLLSTSHGLSTWGRYGSVFNSEEFRESDLYAEVRVGSHKLDQTVDGGLTADLSGRESFNWIYGPEDLDPEAVRYCFWKLTHHKYWEALKDYYDKKKILVEQHLRQEAPSFTKEKPVQLNEPLKASKFPEAKWKDFVRDASGLFRKHKKLIDPYVTLRGVSRARVYVNSEGSKFISQDRYYELSVKAWCLSKEGVYLSSAKYFHGRDPSHLPKLAEVERAIDGIRRDLDGLVKSKPMDPYAGPALLSGLATGLLFHEAIGHRLEGERMTSRTEGHTFAAKLGKRILPESVQLIDDPSCEDWEKKPLYGHYRVDDEGIPSRPVKLVENGVLKTFLLSRAGVPGFSHSNGHGRRERYQDPMARMSNLIVKSSERKSWDELKELLLKSVRDRGMPHGIIIKNVSSGETRTDHYDFQAFKGVPTEVYTIDPRTGKETRVRDVTFIGTPLAAIQRIRGFGADYEVDNSYCYAESGSVPVSTIAPAMLVDELELQRATTNYYRPPVLPFPPMKSK